jgi:hypothetical protein
MVFTNCALFKPQMAELGKTGFFELKLKANLKCIKANRFVLWCRLTMSQLR